MRRVFFLLALALLFPPYLFGEYGRFKLGVETKLDTILTRVDPFPAKAQPDAGIGLNLEATSLSGLGIGVAFGYHWTGASNLEVGFSYGAYSGIDMRLFISLRFPTLVKNEVIVLLFGSNQGAVARMDRYEFTTLYFFYMGFFIQPFLELGFIHFPPASIQLSLPFSYYVRKDADLSFSLGLGLSFKIAPLRGSW